MNLKNLLRNSANRVRRPIRFGADLLGQDQTLFQPPRNLGLNLSPAAAAWSLNRIMGIVDQLCTQPTAELMLQARYGRHCLSRFWLEAPVDQLPQLWSGSIGDLQRQLLISPLMMQPLSRDEQRWRHRLLETLNQGEPCADRWNYLLAVLSYLESKKLPESIKQEELPAWIGELHHWCVSNQIQPKGLLSPGSTDQEMQISQPQDIRQVHTHDIRYQLPRLVSTSTAEIIEMLNDERMQKRAIGLIRLLQVDPDDAEVIEELQALRLIVGQLLLDIDGADLENLYRSSIGDLYRHLVQSSFCRLDLTENEEDYRDALMKALLESNTGRDESLLLAIPLFHPIERVEINLDTFSISSWIHGAWSELNDGTPSK